MIHIYQRHCNVSSNSVGKSRPEWFSREGCFQNLLKTTSKHKNIKITIMFDGEPNKDHFINKYNSDFYELVKREGGDDARSFLNVVNYVAEQNLPEDDIVYFLEDDYMHTHNWVDTMLEGFNQMSLDYLTLYDHSDKYFLPMYENLTSKIFTTSKHHWRTTPSTCGSFIISKDIFEEDFIDHTTIVGDHNKFLQLTQTKNRFVLTPIPGLSTHCMEGLLSPTINWQQINS